MSLIVTGFYIVIGAFVSLSFVGEIIRSGVEEELTVNGFVSMFLYIATALLIIDELMYNVSEYSSLLVISFLIIVSSLISMVGYRPIIYKWGEGMDFEEFVKRDSETDEFNDPHAEKILQEE